MATFFVLLLVLAAIILPCLAVVGVGLWVKKRLVRFSPNSQLLLKINSSHVLAAGCMVIVLTTGAAAHVLAPGTPLASFIGSPVGVISLFAGAWLCFVFVYVGTTYLSRHRPRKVRGRA